jgi:prephenate dehydrogenase
VTSRLGEATGVNRDSAASAATTTVVIVGTGLIGTSIGLALRGVRRAVHLRDHVLSHARVAEGLGAGTLEPAVSAEVDLVVVAVPPRALAPTIRHALQTYPRATVTDVGSVKAGILGELWDDTPGLERYVGSHPMAGSQHSGPITARADLFTDCTWVVTPHRRSAPTGVDRVRSAVRDCGAYDVVMDVEEHDRAVASVSHLPHLVSVLMAGQLTRVPDAHLRLAGQGLRDVTRVAGGDPRLWEQILAANSAAVLGELRSVYTDLGRLISAVEGQADSADPRDSADLREELERAVTGVRKIPGKHGTAPVSYAQVVVEIPDAPGALGRLFADVGEAGVNVEDLSIEHDQIRQVGYLTMAVAPAEAGRLEEVMHDRGWDVRP